MRIERSQGNSADIHVASALAGEPTGMAAAQFATVLRQHQQRQVGTREPQPRADEATSRKTAARPTAQHDSSGGKTAASLHDEAADELAVGIESWRSLALLRAPAEHSPAASGAAGHREIRRRRNLGDIPQSPCIEVTHARTAGRFLLSRENGVWVLSLQQQSAMPMADLQSLVETLRAHFSERGLGPIDIVV